MPPNLEEYYSDNGSLDTSEIGNVHLILSPISLTPESDIIQSDPEISETEIEAYNYDNNFQVPLEHNLRELLVKVTDTEDLNSVTELKLRVIAREVALQQLGIHTPSLRKLILDGSFISTLRDLGSGLRNLTILHVNRCSLNCIDSVFGFEKLEELRAADNHIHDVLPCVFLNSLITLDVQRNCLNKRNTMSYLSLSSNLENIYLQGNDDIETISNYREIVKSMASNLKSLDGIPYTDGSILNENQYNFNEDNTHEISLPKLRSPRNRISSGFVVTFPPRVFVDRPLLVENGHIFMRGDQIIPSTNIQIENLDQNEE